MTAPALPVLLGVASTLPSGQSRLVFPLTPRRPHPTGVQVPCAACERVGVPHPRQGLPYRFADDPTPLCLPCWRAEERRRQRAEDQELLARFWEQVGGVESPAADGDEGLVLVAEVEAEPCPVCGAEEPSPTCWLCGFTWIAQARAEFETELELDARAVDSRIALWESIASSEARVSYLTDWVDRLRGCLEAYARPRRGSQGRPVELLADLMARNAAALETRRGRPSAVYEVAAILAVDSDWRSGRRAMPGRDNTAELAGCGLRAVSGAWRRCEALGWATRTREGRWLTLAERVELGRSKDRAEWDLSPLHISPVDAVTRAEWVPVALGVLGDLLTRAQGLLDEALEALDVARSRDGGWVDWSERVESARRRRDVARVVESVCSLESASGLAPNFRTPPLRFKGEYFSSCSFLGFGYARDFKIRSEDETTADGRRTKEGASRSPTRSGRRGGGPSEGGGTPGRGWGAGCEGAQAVQRPRKNQGKLDKSQRVPQREAPDWVTWAPALARELTIWWPWLAKSPRRWIQATLGRALGPDWRAEDVVTLVRERCGPMAAEVHAPAAYLKTLLAQALSGPRAPKHAARASLDHQRAQSLQIRSQAAEHATQARAEDSDRREAAQQASGGSARAIARQIVMAATARAAAQRDAKPTGLARIGGARRAVAEDWPR